MTVLFSCMALATITAAGIIGSLALEAAGEWWCDHNPAEFRENLKDGASESELWGYLFWDAVPVLLYSGLAILNLIACGYFVRAAWVGAA